MTRFLTLAALASLLTGCSLVTLPVKVATKTVETAVDVTATTVDIITPDGDDEDKDKAKDQS